MIFVDSNVPMNLVGTPHPNRDAIEGYLRSHADETFVTSAEVYQEIIHRYVAIERRKAIDDCFALLDDLTQRVFPVTKRDVERARAIASQQPRLSGRDCLHVAIMEQYDVLQILTCDEGFDYWTGIRRVP
ncbi:MAG TPA: type II toxin-antitoxin system VapC family toxin [Vicinamibacteria bacterium]|nr:type II toxin-antitoxin system VapC family toxin [Vicinamibacteria bacterium]